MNFKQVNQYILSGHRLLNRKFALVVWFGCAVIGVSLALSRHELNNYLIYTNVYHHLIAGQDLYASYPAQYQDVNLYGPFFGMVIAPFAWLPDSVGVVLWVITNAAFLLFAFNRLPIPSRSVTALLFLCSNELLIASNSVQLNPIICGCILLAFAYTSKGKDVLALFFIMAAGFIKIYGFVGLAFFFFSKDKLRFAGWAIVWALVFFCAPLLISNLSFLLHSYGDWFTILKEKNAKNISLEPGSIFQNVSVQGMIARIFGIAKFNEFFVLIPAAILFMSQYLKYRYFQDTRLRLYILCSVLLATVIFSSSAESSTYIIAVPGLCIWYFLQPKTRGANFFFAFSVIVTTFCYTDVLSSWLSNKLFRPYSLKAMMPFALWLIIIVQVYKKQFLKARTPIKDQKPRLSAV